MVGLAPRALRDCAPSAPWGASARPLNFTVRQPCAERTDERQLLPLRWCRRFAQRHCRGVLCPRQSVPHLRRNAGARRCCSVLVPQPAVRATCNAPTRCSEHSLDSADTRPLRTEPWAVGQERLDVRLDIPGRASHDRPCGASLYLLRLDTLVLRYWRLSVTRAGLSNNRWEV